MYVYYCLLYLKDFYEFEIIIGFDNISVDVSKFWLKCARKQKKCE